MGRVGRRRPTFPSRQNVDFKPADTSRKLLSLARAGEHHVLRTEIGQEIRAQAAEDVWGGEDWSQVARQVQRRREIDEIRRSA